MLPSRHCRDAQQIIGDLGTIHNGLVGIGQLHLSNLPRLRRTHSRANESGKHRIMLEGYGYRWYRVGGLDYLLRRSDIDQRDTDAG